MKKLINPENVILIDGSKEQLEKLKDIACQSGELIKLNEEKLPNSFLHRSHVDDVSRVEECTFICTERQEDVGSTNNWMKSDEAYKKLYTIAKDSYNGRDMYVIPFLLGPENSKFSLIGVEITDSIYVVLNMAIMTKVGKIALDQLKDSNDFTRCLHCKCDLDKDNRYICHFPEDNTIISLNSAYGGNALLSKKCMGLRLASNRGKKEGWLAEHMLILEISRPKKENKYILAAFPSACGKTNFSMLIPPEHYLQKGYKISCVGDDIAWIRKDDKGQLWAVNPESGFFGVAPGTNSKTNNNALISTKKDSIFTNVAYNKDDGTVWWEGLTETPPDNLIDWKGEQWINKNDPAAHPNSRFTSPIVNCPCLSDKYFSTNGVKISAIIFGGRRSDTIPLVYEAFDWNHGVFIGSSMSSETTSASNGKTGVIRHDPFAMLPFCGYNICDYFQHWIDFGNDIDKDLKVFNVNWFNKDKDNKYIWPGFSDNMRVLDWIVKRCDNEVDARKSPIGYLPFEEDIDISDLNISDQSIKSIINIDKNLWLSEINNIESFYNGINENLPHILIDILNNIKKQLTDY